MGLGRVPRQLAIAAGIYLLVTICVLAAAPRERLQAHTPYNHYALQADAWLRGRLDLGGPPPPYTGNNDFAQLDGKHYISFPPVPAALLLPVVAYAGSVERVRDGQFFFWLAGIGPAFLFLALERLRRSGRNRRSELENALLAVLFALGSVYWFSAAQGTVWFAGHVVAVALGCAYLFCSLDAAHPVAAGLLLALAFGTRPSLGFAFPLFLFELWRRAQKEAATQPSPALGELGGACVATMLRRGAMFAAPAGLILMALMWHNHARFGDPTEFGHRLLTVVWRKRIETWGLFSYHYLGKNLGVILSGLPFHSAAKGWQINAHGLALWLTTPVYLWAFWPRKTSKLFWAMAVTALAVALPSLLYQNTGWIQFGYRFSNDFAPFLFVMIALGGRRFSTPFWLLAAWGIAINGFGALTFGKAAYRQMYFIDGSQRVLHQPD